MGQWTSLRNVLLKVEVAVRTVKDVGRHGTAMMREESSLKTRDLHSSYTFVFDGDRTWMEVNSLGWTNKRVTGSCFGWEGVGLINMLKSAGSLLGRMTASAKIEE